MKLIRCAVILAVVSGLCPLSAQTVTEYQICSSQYAVWYVYDTTFYKQYKTQVDSIIHVLDRGIPGIVQYLGVAPPDETIIAE
jgi:hypothetical protein